MYNWIESKPYEFVFGNPNRGGGVYLEGEEWWGNAVTEDEIVGLGPYETLDEAMSGVEKEFERLSNV